MSGFTSYDVARDLPGGYARVVMHVQEREPFASVQIAVYFDEHPPTR